MNLNLTNRLVRTRMLGGVGRAVNNDRPYPIRRTVAANGYTSSVTVAEYFSIAVTLSSAGHIEK